ncbi:stage III sporulation protein AE [Halobacteroides halobius DSM 5150]|uniref:Stage III sporulation protein AE n=1 Tax=Halobacteroides halobius (strain ATCC 35273 / DSM 5150 / MD-1) TaxID=748449 RepID=L0K665_HALHC|nr:stage III sporulation protein AE [Halobacteroides halobius]AGB40511.1 stage III sporulation protein AE [Halobacteroides halobius DSM 5150]
MKKLFIMLTIVVLMTIPVQAEDKLEQIKPEEIIENQLENFDLNKLEKEVDKLNKETGEYLPALQVTDIINLFSKQGLENKFQEIVRGLLHYFFDEIVINSKLLGQLIVLAMVVAVLKNFQANFAVSQVSQLANGITYLVLAIVALNSFKVAITVGQGTIQDMVGVMYAIIPLLLSLLISMGNLASASLFHPITFLIVNTLSTIVKNFVFPIIFLSTVLEIVDNISNDFKVSGLVSLLRQLAMGALGVVTTIFLAAIITQGTVATVSDGVTIRTAKYLTSNFIPVVGGFLSSALDVMIGGSLLIKNALGLFSVLIILVFCSFSVIKILALVFIYRFAAAIIQPVSDDQTVNCLNILAGNLLRIFGSVVVVGVMFFVVIIIVVGTANFTVMMR